MRRAALVNMWKATIGSQQTSQTVVARCPLARVLTFEFERQFDLR